MDRDEYLEYRKGASQGANEEIGKYDRYVLALASGAIGLSLTYWDKIAGTGAPVGLWFLFAAWSFFALSLVSVLISHYCAFRSHHYDLHQIDQQYELGEQYEWKVNGWSRVTEKLNMASLMLFIFGAVCLMVFAYSNLERKSEMSKETPPSRVAYIQNGRISVSPPKPQTKPTSSTTVSRPTSKGTPTRT